MCVCVWRHSVSTFQSLCFRRSVHVPRVGVWLSRALPVRYRRASRACARGVLKNCSLTLFLSLSLYVVCLLYTNTLVLRGERHIIPAHDCCKKKTSERSLPPARLAWFKPRQLKYRRIRVALAVAKSKRAWELNKRRRRRTQHFHPCCFLYMPLFKFSVNSWLSPLASGSPI